MKPIILDPYYYPLFIVIGEKALNKCCKKIPSVRKTLPDLDSVLGLTIRLNDGCIIFLKDDEDIDEATIYHEALHATHFLMDSRGIPITVDNTEIVAYTQGHIVEVAVKALNKELIKRGKK